MICMIMLFTDRNKATVTFNIRVTNITGDFTHNRFTRTSWFSEKACIFVTTNASKNIRSSRFKRDFSNTTERIIVKKVDEVLEAVMLILGVTRLPEIADLWVRLSSDLPWWYI